MRASFSEFSYGYASIREAEAVITRIHGRHYAPEQPSLREEETLGWDVKIATPVYALFMQFKLADFVSRRNANSPTWGHVGGPHYRVSIDTDGHQHEVLLRLEEELAPHPTGDVYYVAPNFHLRDDFNNAYVTGQVLDRSVIVLPSEFGEKDGTHHYVTHAASGKEQVLSVPRPPRTRVYWERVVREIELRAFGEIRDTGARPLTVGLLENLLLSVLGESGIRVDQRVTNNSTAAQRIRRLAAVLGCGLVLLGGTADENNLG